MSEIIDPTARRRELRRKKILENAEKRKQKILNAKVSLKIDENCSPNCSSKPETDRAPQPNISSGQEKFPNPNEDTIPERTNDSASHLNLNEPSDDSSVKNFCTKDAEEESVHSYKGSTEESFHASHTQSSTNHSPLLSSANCHLRNNLSEQKIPGEQPRNMFLWILEHPVALCFLALLVCLLINMNYGSLVSNSLVLPFFLWELQYLISFPSDEGSIQPSLFDYFILLSGNKYKWISRLLRKLSEDFSFYLCTIILWQVVIGLPEGQNPITAEGT